MSRAGRQRVVVEAITPQLDFGRFAIKRVAGDRIRVEADVFSDGHDELSVRLLWRAEEATRATAEPMHPHQHGNDRWVGSFTVARPGRYCYTVEGWVDHFRSWVRDLRRRVEASQEVALDLRIGAELVAAAAARAGGRTAAAPDQATSERDAALLAEAAARLAEPSTSEEEKTRVALDPVLLGLMERYPDRAHATVAEPELPVVVDRARARFSAWYELFPRSASPDLGRHGTFRDVIARLPYVAEMGFDILYLPPIHPIGRAFRKGPNNSLAPGPGDPGVPWAIGGEAGGHTALHPELGSMEDFRALVAAAADHGLELALDIAFQASPDHPWAAEHAEWFRTRPDGTIQYAENPPKKYQDIYPFDFESEGWRELWEALHGVMAFWIDEGVRVFRVDNPHTKPFGFWEWAIGRLKADYPELIFLAEAFTRPKVMYRLAKLGFTQSYTYFTWRTTKEEFTDYLTELTATEVSEFFRPNFWPNTPDILHETLQVGGRPMFEARIVLAATLAASYGIYGPAYELLEATPREPGSEEYLDSEKYQQRQWDLGQPDSLRHFITRLNAIRRAHPALQSNENLRFHGIDHPQLLAYSKQTEDGSDTVLTVVNLDARAGHAGTLEVPLDLFGLDAEAPFEVQDLLSDETYLWQGARNRVELEPGRAQAHVFAVRRLRTESQFEAYG
ncbi:MAG: alpha-1,4-glucan--maltose-1-phosphate maltosyltransferase [Chloroflexota bacterium]|nr:alpha-1,4-glucan--maltose-1-phosphate maltosyltransferase [Chloroflexota bacterium]